MKRPAKLSKREEDLLNFINISKEELRAIKLSMIDYFRYYESEVAKLNAEIKKWTR